MWFKELSPDATANFFLNFVKAGDTVLDIGAHIGSSALVASPLAGETGRVISFEPKPGGVRGTQDHHPRIRSHEHHSGAAGCLGSKRRSGLLHRYASGNSAARPAPCARFPSGGIAGAGTVPCTTVDAIAPNTESRRTSLRRFDPRQPAAPL